MNCHPLIALAVAALMTTSARAQLPVARLSHLFPAGGQAGTQVEVTAAGADLDEPQRLHFSHAGITAAPKDGKFLVTIASNVPPGVHEARFAGRFGLSNPRAFAVGALPEAIAPATNTAVASATELTPNTTVNGRAQPNAAAWFRFTARKTQRLFIECLGETLDSRMDATLILSDAAGHELERARSGGLIDFTAPADGEYRLRVADFLFRGGEDYLYRLTLSTGPRLDFILPAAGVAGTRTNFTLYGRNLPGGQPVQGMAIDGKPLEQLTVMIDVPAETAQRRGEDSASYLAPSAAALDSFAYRLESKQGNSNPLLIGLATAPTVLEQEPNDRQAQKIVPPCEISGQFFPANDADAYAFDAKKGDVFWIEVISQRLGLPTDPFVVLQRVTKSEKGGEQFTELAEAADQDTNLGDREFNTASRDLATRFEAKEDGTYRIVVRDLFGRTKASPQHVYRLAVRRETPDFRLAAMAVAPKYKADAKDIPIGIPLLRRGETIAVRVMAFRRDGFNGDIELSLPDPPPGLRFEGDRIESGKSTDYILLTATEDAPAFAGPIRLVGKAKVGDKELVRVARGGTMRFSVGSTDSERAESRVTGEFTLAISDHESAPITVAAEKKTWEAAANAKLDIPLRVTRRGDFNAAFKLKPLAPGAQDSLKEFDVDAKATNITLKLDLAALKLAPGSYVVSAQGITTGKYRNNPEAAAAADKAAKEAEKLAKELVASAKTASEEFDKAGKAAADAEAAAKSAAEKLASAKGAAEKSPEDEKAKSALAAAQKASEEAGTKAKATTEAKGVAEKSKQAAEAKSKDAQARKDESAKRAKELNDKAKPRDVSYQVTAAPITIKVVPVPVAEMKDAKESKPQAKSK